MTTAAASQALADLVERHRELYESPTIDARLKAITRTGSHTNLTQREILNIVRTSRSIFFDSHVEVVSGHHTATYLRFESIARFPELVMLLALDMADWIRRSFHQHSLAGLVATSSSAKLLAEKIADQLSDTMPLRVALTPYSCETGRIGTEVTTGEIGPSERFLALNDVTTRGNCVSKLGKVITDHGGVLAGMMVFARRDSGQFPFMEELVARYPFYYTIDLDMPQWEPAHCPLCQTNKLLLSWKDMPED